MSKYKVAITGGIGSGKSTVCQYLKETGVPVFSCDEISKQLFEEPKYQKELLQLFPASETNGMVDRKKLATIVFSNSEQLKRLNAFSHEKIMEKLFCEMDATKASVSFAEVPLLFEGGYEIQFDCIIVVERSLEARIAAVCLRDGIEKDDVLKRIDSQWDYDSVAHQKIMQRKNYFSIQNTGDENQLKISLKAVLRDIEKLLS